MDRLEFIAIGDLHLNGLNSLFPNYAFDPNTMIYRSLRSVFKYARRNAVKHVIFLGDVFHTPHPTQAQQRELLSFFMQYSDLDKRLIAGNHDYSAEDQLSLEMVDFASQISQDLSHTRFYTRPELITLSDIPVSLLPWPHSKTLERGSVNIAHVETAGSVGDTGHTMKKGYELTPKALYIIGHLHRRQTYKNRVYYPGTLYQRTFGEPLPKGFCHVTIERRRAGLQWNLDWIQVRPPYELHNVRIEDVRDFKTVPLPDETAIKQYKLFVKRGVEFPIGFLQEHTNVVEAPNKLNKREMTDLEPRFDLQLPEQEQEAMDKRLTQFLEKEGLEPEEIATALKIVERYQHTL